MERKPAIQTFVQKAKLCVVRYAAIRKAANWWVVSAKKEETRIKRLEQLIKLSAAGQTIPQFTRRPK